MVKLMSCIVLSERNAISMFYFAADIQYNSLFFSGCIAVTSAEDGSAETTQYLILQGPDDGKYHQ